MTFGGFEAQVNLAFPSSPELLELGPDEPFVIGAKVSATPTKDASGTLRDVFALDAIRKDSSHVEFLFDSPTREFLAVRDSTATRYPRANWQFGADPFVPFLLFKLTGVTIYPEQPENVGFLGYDFEIRYASAERVLAVLRWDESISVTYEFELVSGFVFPEKVYRRIGSATSTEIWSANLRSMSLDAHEVARGLHNETLWASFQSADEKRPYRKWPDPGQSHPFAFSIDDAVHAAGECPTPPPPNGCHPEVQEYFMMHPQAHLIEGEFQSNTFDSGSIGADLRLSWKLRFSDSIGAGLDFRIDKYPVKPGTAAYDVYDISQKSGQSPHWWNKTETVTLGDAFHRCQSLSEAGTLRFLDILGLESPPRIQGRIDYGLITYECARAPANPSLLSFDPISGLLVLDVDGKTG